MNKKEIMEEPITIESIKKELGIELDQNQYDELALIDLEMSISPESQVYLMLKVLKCLNLMFKIVLNLGNLLFLVFFVATFIYCVGSALFNWIKKRKEC